MHIPNHQPSQMRYIVLSSIISFNVYPYILFNELFNQQIIIYKSTMYKIHMYIENLKTMYNNTVDL